MGFVRVCSTADVAVGEMAAYFLEGWEVLVVRDRDGRLRALDGICPHEDFPLVHGDFDGTVITCLNHHWSFDATTGRGINPPSCKLTRYAIEVDGDDVLVDVDDELSQEPRS
jgi:toluene monooxygenase system ferredoxin subunit